MPSPAFSKQYREWLARHFQRVYRQAAESLSQAITARRPDLVAPALKELAICLHTRGAVSAAGLPQRTGPPRRRSASSWWHRDHGIP